MRRYTITIDMPDDYCDVKTTNEDLNALRSGNLSIDELTELAESDGNIKIEYKVEDI